MEMQKSFMEIAKHPTTIFALIGVIILILGFIKIRKVKITTRMITYIGISLAIATILKIFRLGHLPQGGSITLGSMVPIMLIAFFYGPEMGYLTGFLYGIITLIIGPYILHPVQVLFDYPLPFMALGVCGYFRNNKILGCILALFLRFLAHFISGVVFFASYAGDMNPYLYSLMVNGILVGIEGIICIVIISILHYSILYRIFNKKNLG